MGNVRSRCGALSRVTALLVFALVVAVLASVDGSSDSASAHSGFEETGSWVSVHPRWVHVEELGMVTISGGGFTPGAAATLYMVDSEDAALGCPLEAASAVLSLTTDAGSDGLLSVDQNLGGIPAVAGHWAVCAKEGSELARGDVFAVVSGPVLSMDDVDVGLGDTVAVSGRGFSVGQTVTVFAVASDDEEDDCGERCRISSCPSFDVDKHLLAATGSADSDGGFTGLEFDLGLEEFGTSTQWGFCAVGGRGDATMAPLHVHFGERWGAGDGWVLQAGAENVVWFSPPLVGRTVKILSVGGRHVSPLSEFVEKGAFSELSFVLDMLPGDYTMVVYLTGDGPVWEHEVSVVAAEVDDDPWILESSLRSLPSGAELLVTGVAPDGTEEVTLFGVAPSEVANLTECPGPRGYPVLGVAPVKGDNTFRVDVATGHEVMDEVGRWALCASDGEESRSKKMLRVELEVGLLVVGGVLYRDVKNEIALVPEVGADVTVSKVVFDGLELEGEFLLRVQEGLAVFDLEIDVAGGGYVLVVQLSDGTELAKVVAVSRTAVGSLDLLVSPSTVSVGDVVNFVGEGYAANLTVKVFLVEPTEAPEDGKCPAAAGYETLVSLEATSDGEVVGTFEVESDVFDDLGVWMVCAVDGAGGRVELPAELTVVPGLVLPVSSLVRFVKYDVEFRPGLAPGTEIKTVSFGGVLMPGPWGFDDTGEYPFFVFSTERDEGRYTLRVELSDGFVAELVVDVLGATHEPELVVSRRLEYGQTAQLRVEGYRANGPVGLVAVKLNDDNDGLTCEEVSQLEEGVLDFVWAAAVDGGDVADDSGSLNVEIEVVIESFDTPGDWLFCVLDRPARIAAEGVRVLLAPSIAVGEGGRVQVGDEVRVQVLPELSSDEDVGYVKLDGTEIEYTVEGGAIVWAEVPRKVGTFLFSVELFGVAVSQAVTVLSGVPPGLVVRGDALECPGLMEFRDAPGPGVETPVTLRFLLSRDGTLLCPVAELAATTVGGTLVGVEATTVLPSQDLVVEFPPEYTVPTDPKLVVVVGSFDNEFGHRYEPRGVDVLLSQRDDRNHRVVIPGCGSWVDSRGNSAPCKVDLAKDITVIIQALVKLPSDASEMYPTQVVYGESSIWELVEFGASMLVVESEISYGESITLNGNGFPEGERLLVYGVNASLEEPGLPEGEDGWTCDVMALHGKLLEEFPPRSTGTFTGDVKTGLGLGVFPGRWDICVVSSGGLSANELDSVVVNYVLKPQAGGEYEAGSVGYVRVEPGLPEEFSDVMITVDGQNVDSELMLGNEVHFTAPTGLSGDVRIAATFNDGLESYVDAAFGTLVLGLRVVESAGVVRIGSLLELSVDRLSGDSVCVVELGGVQLNLLDDGTMVDGCAVVGANRDLDLRVLVLAVDGGVSAELVDLFEVGGTVELKVVSTDDEEMTGSVELLRPSVDVTDDGKRIDDNILLQFRPVLVSGHGFPRDTAHFDGVSVGYEVRDERTWQTHTGDGEWSNVFRVTGRTEVGRRLEFVPLIGGHRMESLAFVLTVGVSTPVVEISPSVVETGLEVTLRASNLLGYVGGYGFLIKEDGGSGGFWLLDSATGKALDLVTDRDGNVERTFLFPDYEAFFYDDQGRASLELQLVNSAREEVPEAIVRITHVKTEPVAPAPTAAPDDSAVVEPVLVERVPFPTAQPQAVPPLVGVLLPTPTRWGLVSHGGDIGSEGPPDGINHSRVLVETGANGTTVTLTWLEPLGEFAPDGYLVSRALTRGGKAVPAAVPHHGLLPLYVDLDVLPDKSYWYYIIPYNDYGLAKSAGLTPVEVRTVGAPGMVPRFERVSDDGENYQFEWDAPEVDAGRNAPVHGYLIEAKAAEGGDWVVVSRPTGGVLAAELRKFADETLVRYRVAAVNGVGRGPWQEWQRPMPSLPVLGVDDEGGFPWLVVLVGLALVAVALVVGWFVLRWWLGRPDRFEEKPLRAYDAGTWMIDLVEVPPHLAETAEADDGEGGPYSGRLTDELGDGDGGEDTGVEDSGHDGVDPPAGGGGDSGGAEATPESGGGGEPDSRGVGAPGELRRSVFVYPDPGDPSLGGGSQPGS